MTRLSINLNKVALLRNQRDLPYPDICLAAQTLIDAGADGITVHPRPDARHIRKSDVYDLAKWRDGLTGEYELNIEGYPSKDFIDLVFDTRPEQITLVPDGPNQTTSDHGWNIKKQSGLLIEVLDKLKPLRCKISLFMDGDADQIAALQPLMQHGLTNAELYTGPYAISLIEGHDLDIAIAPYLDAAIAAREIGLSMNAGHDLSLANLQQFLTAIPDIHEVSIGHGFIADSLWLGFAGALSRYRALILD